MTNTKVAIVVTLLCLPQAILQILSLTLQPQHLTVDMNSDESEGRKTCQGQGVNGAKNDILNYCYACLALLVVGLLVVAHHARLLPSLLNESRVIYDTTVTTFLLAVLGFGVVQVTNAPTSPPDVPYLVWVIVVLATTVNASVRIMYPKLTLVWSGQTVLVSKLVADHRLKQNERRQRQQHQNRGDHKTHISGLNHPLHAGTTTTNTTSSKNTTTNCNNQHSMGTATGVHGCPTKRSFRNTSDLIITSSILPESTVSREEEEDSGDDDDDDDHDDNEDEFLGEEGQEEVVFLPDTNESDEEAMTGIASFNPVGDEEAVATHSMVPPVDGMEQAPNPLNYGGKAAAVTKGNDAVPPSSLTAVDPEVNLAIRESKRRGSDGKSSSAASPILGRDHILVASPNHSAQKSSLRQLWNSFLPSTDSSESAGVMEVFQRPRLPFEMPFASEPVSNTVAQVAAAVDPSIPPLLVANSAGATVASSEVRGGDAKSLVSTAVSPSRPHQEQQQQQQLRTRPARPPVTQSLNRCKSTRPAMTRRSERIIVKANEAPSRRLVLRMLNLQETLETVTTRIMSGYRIGEDEWESVRKRANQLGVTLDGVEFEYESQRLLNTQGLMSAEEDEEEEGDDEQ